MIYSKIKTLFIRLETILFFVFKKIQFQLAFPKKKKILFSYKEDWKKQIKVGFKFTNQTIIFEKLSKHNINKYDLVVPLTIQDLLFLDKNRGLIKNNLIPIPNKESILLCDDKSLFNETLINNGF